MSNNYILSSTSIHKNDKQETSNLARNLKSRSLVNQWKEKSRKQTNYVGDYINALSNWFCVGWWNSKRAFVCHFLW